MDIKAFLDAIGGDLVALMSGIGSLVLLILGLTIFHKKNVPRWIVLVVALICLLCAAARVWTAEHRLRLAKEQQLQDLTVPQFEAYYTVSTATPNLTGGTRTSVILNGRIINRGAPSIINDWELYLKFSDGKVLHGQSMLPPGRDFHLTLQPANGSPFFMDGLDYLPTKSISAPIPTGGAVAGWVYFLFPDISQAEVVREKPTVVLTLTDVTGKAWVFDTPLTGPWGHFVNPYDLQKRR
jgi:hypothetical protein